MERELVAYDYKSQLLEERKQKIKKMKFKTCSICGEKKLISKFAVDKRNKDGRMGICKVCRSRKYLQYYHQNREEQLIRVKKYKAEHRESRRIYQKDYREEHKEHLKIVLRKWYLKNRKTVKKKSLKFYWDHKEACQARKKLWRIKNKEKIREYNRGYRLKNRGIN